VGARATQEKRKIIHILPIRDFEGRRPDLRTITLEKKKKKSFFLESYGIQKLRCLFQKEYNPPTRKMNTNGLEKGKPSMKKRRTGRMISNKIQVLLGATKKKGGLRKRTPTWKSKKTLKTVFKGVGTR